MTSPETAPDTIPLALGDVDVCVAMMDLLFAEAKVPHTRHFTARDMMATSRERCKCDRAVREASHRFRYLRSSRSMSLAPCNTRTMSMPFSMGR